MKRMTSKKILNPILLIWSFIFLAATGYAQQHIPVMRVNHSAIQYKQDEIIVKFSPSAIPVLNVRAAKGIALTGIAELDRLNRKYSAIQIRRVIPYSPKFEAKHKKFGLTRYYVIKFSGPIDVKNAVQEYALDRHIEKSQLNHKYQLLGLSHTKMIPNDQYFDLMWNLNNTGQDGGTPDADIDAPEAWDIQTGDPSVIVSDLDSGQDQDHPDLADNLWVNPNEIPDNGIDDDGNGYVDDVHGWDFSDGDNDPDDYHGHGTHTAGTVAALGNNSIGTIGVAFHSKIMSCKIFPNAYDDVIAEAFTYAADMGAKVSTNSWGGGGQSDLIEDAIDYNISNDVVVVFAAGNDGSDSPALGYPGSYPPVIAVAATDRNDHVASWSNYGDWVDISAPGVDIPSTYIGSQYAYMSGTSMACPHVAGVAALIRAEHPDWTNDQVRARLEATAENIDGKNPGYEGLLGSGRVNAFLALYSGTIPNPPENLAANVSGNDIALTWSDPTTNTDGSPLTDLSWIRIYKNGVLIDSTGPGVQSYNYTASSNGVYHFQVQAVNSAGIGSELTDPVQAIVGTVEAIIWQPPGVSSVSEAIRRAQAKGMSITPEDARKLMERQMESASQIQQALSDNGVVGLIVSDITTVNLADYNYLFVVLGYFPVNHLIPQGSDEANAIVDYLTNHNGHVYMEGGDCWFYDPAHGGEDFNSYFKIVPLNDGPYGGAVNNLYGANFADGLNFAYSGGNNYMDQLQADDSNGGFVVHANDDPSYAAGIGYDGGTSQYRTIGTAFEFGGLVDNSINGTRADLMAAYLDFFQNGYSAGPYIPAPGSVTALGNYDGVVPLYWEAPPGYEPFKFDPKDKTGMAWTGKTETPKPVPEKSGRKPESTLQGYNVYRAETAGGPYTQIATNVTRQYFRDNSVTNGTTYYYVITAVYDDGESVYSAEISATPADGGYSATAGWASSAPTIDGNINAAEWADATHFDIQTTGMANPVRVYVMNTNSKLYIAVDDQNDGSLDDFDQIGIYFDTNYDHEWPENPPSTEGNFWIYYHNNAPSNYFRGISGHWPNNVNYEDPVEDSNVMQGISAASGNVQYETAIDLQNSHLQANMGDSLGMYFYAIDNGTQTQTGNWPAEVVWNAPFSYGMIRLGFPAYPVPNPPTNLAASASGSDVSLTWTDPTTNIDGSPITNGDHINVYRDGTKIGEAPWGSGSYTDSGVSNGSHAYYVTAVNSDNMESAQSDEVSVLVGTIQALIWAPPEVTGQNIDPVEKAKEKKLPVDQVRRMIQNTHINSFNEIKTALEDNGVSSMIVSDITAYNLSDFQYVFCVMGMFPNNHRVLANSDEANALLDYLNNGGHLYIEGGDFWYFDPTYGGGQDFGPLFGIHALDDGASDLNTVLGHDFVDGYDYTYSGINSWVDRVEATDTGVLIHSNNDPEYGCGVANAPDAGYKTIGNSFMFGGLDDGSASSYTKDNLMAKYLEFFGGAPAPGMHVLLVDDDEGETYETFYEASLTDLGVNYDVWDYDAQGVPPSASTMAGYDAVIWFCGDDFMSSITPADTTELQPYLRNGGKLFVTGQDIGFDIGRPNGSTPLLPFYNGFLHAAFVQDNVGLGGILGVSGDPIGDNLSFNIFGGDGADNQSFPSEIDPVGSGQSCLTYNPNVPLSGGNNYHGGRKKSGAHPQGIISSGTAGVRADTAGYRTVYFAFGFEAIDAQATRDTVMNRVLTFLAQGGGTPPPPPPTADALIWAPMSGTSIPPHTPKQIREMAKKKGVSVETIEALLGHNLHSENAIKDALEANGKTAIITSTLSGYNLSDFQYVFVVLGVYPNNYTIDEGSDEANAIEAYLANGGRVYMEGGDCWYFDPLYGGGHDFGPTFHISPLDDGGNDLNNVVGFSIAAGLTFSYSGDNSWIDRLAPIDTAMVAHVNDDPAYECGIAYDYQAGSYRTIGTSFEFGGLDDNGANTKTALMADYLNFFDNGHAYEPFEPPPQNMTAWNGYDGAVPLAWDPPIGYEPLNLPDIPEANGTNASSPKKVGHKTRSGSFHLKADLVSYNVYRSETPGGPYTEIASNVQRQYFRDASVVNGHTYYYMVKAKFSDGNESDPSDETSGTPNVPGFFLRSGWAQAPPTLDGTIDASEWANAQVVDIALPGMPNPVKMYAMNDGSHLYLAVDDKNNTATEDYDQLGIYFDTNHDYEWPETSPSNEGNFWLEYFSAGNATEFRGWYGHWPLNLGTDDPIPADGVQLAVSAESGNVQYEAVIDLQTSKLTVGPGSVFGYRIYAYDAASGQFTGRWPAESIFSAPFTYGEMLLAQAPSASKIYVNCGGPSYTDDAGNTWQADQPYTSGSWGYLPGGDTYATTAPIANTDDDTLYQTERYGMSGYRFDVPNGIYRVTLKFAEIFFDAPNKRVFDVSIENQLKINDLDIFARVGKNTALNMSVGVLSTDLLRVNDGHLDISFVASKDNPKISAIEVERVSSTPPPTEILVNAGGMEYVDPTTGEVWAADHAYTSGGWGYDAGHHWATTAPIAGTDNDPLFQSERYGMNSYKFDVPNGSYDVTLLFAEIYFNAPGKRVFDVSVEDSLVADDLDIFATTGKNAAYSINISNVSVNDGQLNIDFAASVDNPKVSAIKIVRHNDTAPPALSIDPHQLNFGNSATELSFHITNRGDEPMQWNAIEDPNQNWIVGLSPNTGTLNGGESASVTVSVSRDGLASGSYAGNITVTTATDTQHVTILMTVAGPPSGHYLVRLNAGGDEYVDSAGQTWSADQAYSNGSWGYEGGTAWSTTHAIQGTEDDPLYQTERYGMSSYKFDVPNGVYRVKLLFAENYWNAPNKRLFSVSIEGQTVIDNLDIFARVGKFHAFHQDIGVTATGILVHDGQLNIDFAASVDNAKVDGIEVAWVSDEPPAPPTPVTEVRINCGGPDYVDGDGNLWQADMDYTGGKAWSTSHEIAGTDDDPLYQSERYGENGTSVIYNIPMENGDYVVRLIFAENWVNSIESRVFNILMNGETVLSNYDIYLQAGKYTATSKTFQVSVSDGNLSMELDPVVQNAKINGIEIVPLNMAKKGGQLASLVPKTFGVFQNYPNPFNPDTRIRYQLAQRAEVSVLVFNVMGQEIARLVDHRELDAGYYVAYWNGLSEVGTQVPSGIYFYQVRIKPISGNAKPIIRTMKMMLMK